MNGKKKKIEYKIKDRAKSKSVYQMEPKYAGNKNELMTKR